MAAPAIAAKRPTEQSSEDDCQCKVMRNDSSLDSLECFPISSAEGIENIINNPPTWVQNIPALKKRGNTVIQNVISDCHSEEGSFFPKVRLERKLVPKTMVCHDYKGGYQEDKYFIAVPKGGCYSFYNWAHIDIFVYFSHHLITIPPYCWIKKAHENGVKILGTFITEHSQGHLLCQEFTKDREKVCVIVRQLTKLAEIFKFDGWLLNIENPVEDVSMLKEFVSYLTHSLHNSNPESLVIWYDSVTEKGLLKWQNKLNQENKCFFDICDGIYLNYNWTEDDLISSVQVAQHRYLDIYVGIDVFGRNTFYKQGFDSHKAAQLIRRHNMSMAIFAPGWTQESIASTPENQDTFLERFLSRDFGFWNAFWPYLYTHPIVDKFFTTFYCGTDKDYFDLFNQELQLSKIKLPKEFNEGDDVTNVPTLVNKCSCLQYRIHDKYTTCLITKDTLLSDVKYIHHLFSCDIPLIGEVTLFYHRKPTREVNVKLDVVLSTCNENGAYRKIVLLGQEKEKTVNDMTLIEINPSKDMVLIDEINKQYYYRWSSDGTWELSVYRFIANPCTLLEIGAVLKNGNSAFLCSFGFYNH